MFFHLKGNIETGGFRHILGSKQRLEILLCKKPLELFSTAYRKPLLCFNYVPFIYMAKILFTDSYI